MERRNFLKTAAVTSACALAGAAIAQDKKHKTLKCKITVIKKTLYNDLYKKYRNSDGQICNLFKEGQQFITKDPWTPPEGFCAYAWADIRAYIHSIHAGFNQPMVACCTDGFRPVTFLLEGIEV